MTATLQSLGIDELSIEDRISLATAIWESIAAESHPPLLSEPQKSVLEHRLADHAANPDDVVPWEQIQAEVAARFLS